MWESSSSGTATAPESACVCACLRVRMSATSHRACVLGSSPTSREIHLLRRSLRLFNIYKSHISLSAAASTTAAAPPLLALHLCATTSSPSQLTPFLSPEYDVAYSCDDDCSRSAVRRFRNWKSWCSHVIQYPATWKYSLEDDGIGLAGF